LSGLQKCFDEFAFAADGHAWKDFVSFLIRDFGFGVEPFGEEAELICSNVARSDSVDEVRE
jgi:hypothetical protein